MSKIENLIAEIEKLTLLELNELVKTLQEKFGIANLPAQTAAPTGQPAEAAEKAEEKETYDVILQAIGEKKVEVIKAVRELRPDLGLKDAKDLVESAPKPLLLAIKKEAAAGAKQKLEAVGAKVDLV